MADDDGKNEGLRMLEELVCQAIPDPSPPGSGSEPRAFGRGTNQGVRLMQEVALAAGAPETREAASQRKEVLPRFLIGAIFSARAVELEKHLPVSFDKLDLGEQGIEATVRVVSRYLMARELDLLRPSEVRSTFPIDLAILMAELARPRSIFLAEARKTAADVARRLLRREGWSPAPSAFSEWETDTLAIDPSRADAARQYLALLRRSWGWVGSSMEMAKDVEDVANVVVIPEAILTDMARHCI
jgi:hypothetical protein